MGKRKSQRIGLGLFMAAVLLLAGSLTVKAVSGKTGSETFAGADLLVIDGLKAYGKLERPGVLFYHDKHTQALARDGKDCAACHLKDKERMSLTFNRLADSDKDSVMDIYHKACIGCHTAYTEAKKKSGPVTCGQCHVAEGAPESVRRPIALDKALHFRHVKAVEEKCELCHHEYNAQDKKLFYAKGREGACVYCHKEETRENRISNRLASHQACISCHQQKIVEQKEAGPLQCAGCHDPKQQAAMERPADAPRMARNQPDTVLVKTLRKDEPPSTAPSRMKQVLFDHKAHEKYNDSCRVCHHEDLNACVSCHTIQGSKDGNLVKLSQAMHQQDAQSSCIGCHNLKKEEPRCAGCHHSIPQSRALASEMSCRTCHAGQDMPSNVVVDEAQTKALAAELLAARQPVRGTVPTDQIPEFVTIRKLADQYEAVKLPHRKIVMTLARVNETSQLAAYFHQDPLTLCQGCHHRSPASLNPPQCASCHGRSSEALNLTRPGLMAAYHQQCMECHEEMKLEKPDSRDCAACHAKRK